MDQSFFVPFSFFLAGRVGSVWEDGSLAGPGWHRLMAASCGPWRCQPCPRALYGTVTALWHCMTYGTVWNMALYVTVWHCMALSEMHGTVSTVCTVSTVPAHSLISTYTRPRMQPTLSMFSSSASSQQLHKTIIHCIPMSAPPCNVRPSP